MSGIAASTLKSALVCQPGQAFDTFVPLQDTVEKKDWEEPRQHLS